MINTPLTLVVLVGIAAGSSQVPSPPEKFHYAAAVSFFEGTCQFMTGDVIFDAAGFRDDLRSRFDTQGGLTVYHASDVPAKCVAKALKAARQAGFHDVQDEVGEIHLGLP
jgi:hypothetical protein